MRDEDKRDIRTLHLFRDVSEDTFDALMANSYSQNFPPKLELFGQGQRADFLHILLEGSVALDAEWRGREAVMGVVRPVSSFILAACLRDMPYLMSARTLERSRILMLPALDLRDAIRREPVLGLAVMDELAGSYRTMVRQAKNMKLRTARERLAAWIVNQAHREGQVNSFMLPVEKRELAPYLGMTPESLSRALGALRQDGMVMDGARVIITDWQLLSQVAGHDLLLDDSAEEL